MRFRVDWPIIGLGLTILGLLFYFGRQSTSVRNSVSVHLLLMRIMLLILSKYLFCQYFKQVSKLDVNNMFFNFRKA